MDQQDVKPPRVTLTVDSGEGAEAGVGDKEPDLPKELLSSATTTTPTKSKRKDHKKGRSNSLSTKKSETPLSDSPKSPGGGSPRVRGGKKDASSMQRRYRRKRMAQGLKPCPPEILDETSWERRIADYFVIVSPEVKDGDRHHSTILPGPGATTTMVPVVTDRVPHENYKDTELPVDLGMFCFPDGIAPVPAAERPPSLFHCFNLTDEEGTRLYVACLRTFKKSDLQIVPEGKLCDYTPVALCIVSHHPFISLFKAYLIRISEIMASPSKFSCSAEAYISTILFKVPMPSPGVSEVVCSIDESRDMTVSVPSKLHFPVIDFPLRTVFDILGVHTALKLVFAVMLENKILITSSQYNLLFIFAESLTSLMYPFEWHHVCIDVLSRSLLDYVQAPTPFIQGVPKKFLHLIPKESLSELVVVDIDKAKVSNLPPNFPLPSFVDDMVEELLKVLWPKVILSSDVVSSEPPEETPTSTVNTMIQTIFFKRFISLFHDFRSYINFIKKYPRPLVTFETQMFYSNKNKDDIPFLKAFLDTQAFKIFTDRNTLHQSSLLNYAIEKYNKDNDHELKFISESLAKGQSPALKKVLVPVPTDEKPVPTSGDNAYEINYEFIYYLNSATAEQDAGEGKPEGVSHDEEEVVVEHGLLPKVALETWSTWEIDYVSLCIHMIFSDIEMTKDQNMVLHKILLDTDGPLLFTQLFLEYIKINQISVINDSVYNIISSVLYMVIYNADENNNFLVPYNLLKPLSAIYHEVSGLPEFLIFALGSLGLWNKMEFWLYCFSCCIVRYRKELPLHFRSTEDMWPQMDAKAQADASSKDETVLFNAIGEVSVLMSQLGISVPYVKQFISKCSMKCRLGNSLTSSLTTFATKIIETQKANSDSLLDLKKTKIVPPEKTAERLFKFSKRAKMSHKEIIRILAQTAPPATPAAPDAKEGDGASSTEAAEKGEDGEPAIGHVCANGYDVYTLSVDVGAVSCLEVYKDMVFVGTKAGNVAVWDLNPLKAQSEAPAAAATTSQPREEAAKGAPKLVFVAQPCNAPISLIAPGSNCMAVCSEGGTVTVLDNDKGKVLKAKTFDGPRVTAIAVSSDGLVACGTEDGRITLWNVASESSQPATLAGHTGAVESLVFVKHGTLISGSADRSVRVWDAKEGSEKFVSEGYTASVKFISYALSSKVIVASEEEAKILNIKKKTVVKELAGIKSPVASYAFLKSDPYVLLGLSESGALLSRWNAFDDDAVASLKISETLKSVRACSLGKRGEVTAVGSADGTIHLWCGLSKASLHTFRSDVAPIVALKRVSPKVMVSASEDAVLKVWRVSDEAMEAWSKGSLIAPKVAVPESTESIFRFRHSGLEGTSSFLSSK